MRIAIDARALTGRYTGDRTYWRNLLSALLRLDNRNEYLLYSRLPIPEGELHTDAPNLTLRTLDAPNDRLWALQALPRAVKEDRADILHVQYTVPLGCPCPVVTSVHDISFRLFPQWFPLRHRLLLNLTVPPSMQRAARVIAISESSRQDILRVYKLPPEKVVTTLLGLPEGFAPCSEQETDTKNQKPETKNQREKETARLHTKERYGLDAPFVLAVGVLQPRKNLPLLAEAFGRMKAKHTLPHALVFVGKMGWQDGQEALKAAAAKGGGQPAADAVHFTGYVPDAELPILYQACTAFAHPALYEGFGFTPLEAMACAAPTLVSDAPAMPEVVGDAALIVPATDVNAWSEALFRVLTDRELQQELSERGPLRAAQFSWDDTAQKTLAVYEEAVANEEKQ
jgi:glycosyltransferase involved in cell wall biosynthesis